MHVTEGVGDDDEVPSSPSDDAGEEGGGSEGKVHMVGGQDILDAEDEHERVTGINKVGDSGELEKPVVA